MYVGIVPTFFGNMRIAQDLSMSQARKAGQSLTVRSAARFTRGCSGRTRLEPDRRHERERGHFFPWVPDSGCPCRSQSRWDGKMGVKWPKKGAKWRLLREPATLLFMTQLLFCHTVTLIVVEKSAERQVATTIYSLRICVENMVSQILDRPEKRSIS